MALVQTLQISQNDQLHVDFYSLLSTGQWLPYQLVCSQVAQYWILSW